MIERYSYGTRIKSYETDYRLELKTSALLQHFQDAAVEHATKLGVGYDDMKKNDLFWVVTRFHIEIERMPVYDEAIEVSTWPKKFEALSQKTSSKEKEDFIFFRDFFIKDGNGNPLIRATSSWVMLDFKKKSPQPLSRVPYQFPINEGVHAIAVIPQKIPEAKNPTLIYSKRVGYSDIDLNLHVNNTRYADWVMDVFSHNFLESHILKSMEINYIHEVFWGDIIDFFQGKGKNENSFIIEGIEKHTKKVSFRALMKFEDVCD